MPRICLKTRRRILILNRRGYTVDNIHARLMEEEIFVSKRSIYRLLKKYREHHTYADLRKPPRKLILNKEQVSFIDKEMEKNDEITARKMHGLLLERWPHLNISLSTIKRIKRNLGWVVTRPKYCQLLRDINKQK